MERQRIEKLLETHYHLSGIIILPTRTSCVFFTCITICWLHTYIYVVVCKWFTRVMTDAIGHNSGFFFFSWLLAFSWKQCEWLISCWMAFSSNGRGRSSPSITIFTSTPEKWADGTGGWSQRRTENQIISNRLYGLVGSERHCDVTSSLGRKYIFFYLLLFTDKGGI